MLGRAGKPGSLPGPPAPSTPEARQSSPGLSGLGQFPHKSPAPETRERAHFSLLAAGQLQTGNEKQKLSLDKRFTGACVLAAQCSEHRATLPALRPQQVPLREPTPQHPDPAARNRAGEGRRSQWRRNIELENLRSGLERHWSSKP